MTTRPVRLATRTSPLATAQSQGIADIVSAQIGRPVELVGVTTTGDVTSGPLSGFGGVGVFVGAVREAVLDGRADFGVHSLKDVPTQPHPDLVILAHPKREDFRDALCGDASRTLQTLPPGARVGTGSLRRAAQIRALRPDIELVDIRGNVDTRLGLVAAGEVDVVLLAAAGLARLNRLSAVSEFLDASVMLPAPGQGALALEARCDLAERDADLHKTLVSTDDLRTRAAVISERAVLNELEAGCSAPVGALASVIERADGSGADLVLEALVAATDGSQVIRMSKTGSASDADRLGRELAGEMVSAGAAGLMGSPRDKHETS